MNLHSLFDFGVLVSILVLVLILIPWIDLSLSYPSTIFADNPQDMNCEKKLILTTCVT